MDDLTENLDSERRTLAGIRINGSTSEFPFMISLNFQLKIFICCLKLGLNTTECKSYKSQSRFIDYIKLDSLKGASVAGFKVNLLFTVIAKGNAAIILSSKNVKASAQYKIRKFNFDYSVMNNDDKIYEKH